MKTSKYILRSLQVLSFICLGGCSSLQLVNSVSKFYDVDVKKDLSYGDNHRQRYDLYLPEEGKKNFSSTPVIIFFYGGSWNRGEKSEYEFVGRRLASMGYITAIPNYRLYPEVKYPEFLEDGAQSIVQIQKELSKAEYASYKPASRCILMGHSAGGYNAAMLAFDSRWLTKAGASYGNLIQGFIGVAGAYNIYPISNPEVQPVFNHPDYPEKSQPIEYSTYKQVPSLILTPAEDSLVNIEQNSKALHDALISAGNNSSFQTVEGTDHITLIGTLSPLLFFKGSSVKAIEDFIEALNE